MERDRAPVISYLLSVKRAGERDALEVKGQRSEESNDEARMKNSCSCS